MSEGKILYLNRNETDIYEINFPCYTSGEDNDLHGFEFRINRLIYTHGD